MSENQETVAVPVLEIEFDKLLQILSKINIADSCTFISMPEHVKTYSNRDNMHISKLVGMLLEFEEPDNAWRLDKKTVLEIKPAPDCVLLNDRIVYDSDRVIVVSTINSVYIIPGEQSIKSGRCKPNEIIKLTNLLSSQIFLLKFTDVPNEQETGYDLKVEYKLVEKPMIKPELAQNENT
ncbi:MAG: hypothetical protein IKU15_07425 [Clostridia bacterium]|nr:hypothetical protein [Clostridia bacterium]